MFDWGIFRAVWKGRGGGQELSAEVIGHLFEVLAPIFSISAFGLNISFFMLREEHFSASTLLFFATPKILRAEVG